MKYALPIARAALGGMYGADLGAVDAGVDALASGNNPMLNNLTGVSPLKATAGKFADMMGAGPLDGYRKMAGAALGAGAGVGLTPSDRGKNSITDEEDSDAPAAAPTPPSTPAPAPAPAAPTPPPAPAAPTPPPAPAPTPPTPAPTVGKAPPSSDPMVKNLAPISADGSASPARLNKLAAMAGSQSAKPAATTIADKKMGATFETRLVDMEDDEYWLMEAGKASRAFCKANARKRSNMGASQLSSCISQGYLPHKSGKSVKVADRRIKLDGVKMKGEKYGGPKSTKAGEST
jgi:hypothetical protein